MEATKTLHPLVAAHVRDGADLETLRRLAENCARMACSSSTRRERSGWRKAEDDARAALAKADRS